MQIKTLRLPYKYNTNCSRVRATSFPGPFPIYPGNEVEVRVTPNSKGAFVWDQSGIRIIGIVQVSVCLGAILIPEQLDSILAILLPGAE